MSLDERTIARCLVCNGIIWMNDDPYDVTPAGEEIHCRCASEVGVECEHKPRSSPDLPEDDLSLYPDAIDHERAG